jgi:hypothetical protein
MQDSWIRCLVNKNYASQLHKQREIKKNTREKRKNKAYCSIKEVRLHQTMIRVQMRFKKKLSVDISLNSIWTSQNYFLC